MRQTNRCQVRQAAVTNPGHYIGLGFKDRIVETGADKCPDMATRLGLKDGYIKEFEYSYGHKCLHLGRCLYDHTVEYNVMSKGINEQEIKI